MSHGVVGAILMGGQSRRFGSDKALAVAAGISMGKRVVVAMRRAGIDPVVASGGTAGAELGLVTVPDKTPGAGPLAALASILSWANTGGVVVTPCDLPLLKASDIETIIEAWRANPDVVACATVGGKPSPMLACWPAAAARRLQIAVDEGRSRYYDGLDILGWNGVEVDPASVSDADDPTTLTELLAQATTTESMPDATEA